MWEEKLPGTTKKASDWEKINKTVNHILQSSKFYGSTISSSPAAIELFSTLR
jgi:hypothetical protein